MTACHLLAHSLRLLCVQWLYDEAFTISDPSITSTSRSQVFASRPQMS